jgi:hypothetical protein
MSFLLEAIAPTGHPNLTPYRVVPVRFARAVDGFVDDDAPDLDDHGYTLADEYGPAHGPTLALKRGATRSGEVEPGPVVRVRVVRDRLDPGAALFPKVEDPTIAEVVHPAPDTALSPTGTPASGDTPAREGDCVYVRATSTQRGSVETKLRLHYGAADGPALAEMTLRVHPILYVPVVFHAVTIGAGPAPTTSMATLRQLFGKVNQIYAQAGIVFSLDGTLRNDTINPYNQNGIVLPFAQAGLVSSYTEAKLVLTVGCVANKLNAYFFPNYAGGTAEIAGTWGWAQSRAKAATVTRKSDNVRIGQPGITFRDPTGLDRNVMAWTIAHELGHCLTLEHYDNGQRADTTATPPTPYTVRHDLWAHRNLMHNFVDLFPDSPSTPARVRGGYGSTGGSPRPGSSLTIKKRAGRIFQSDQTNFLRRGVLNGSYKPF